MGKGTGHSGHHKKDWREAFLVALLRNAEVLPRSATVVKFKPMLSLGGWKKDGDGEDA